VIPDAHCNQSALDDMAVGTVTIAHEMVWCRVPREGFGDLMCDLPCCWMVGDAQGDQPSPLVSEDDAHE
jgi:hypothetical protein